MPLSKHYTVTQTREVDVVAEGFVDAIRIAEAAFKLGDNTDAGVAVEGVWGNTYSPVTITDTSMIASSF